jgi:hypothetical protein
MTAPIEVSAEAAETSPDAILAGADSGTIVSAQALQASLSQAGVKTNLKGATSASARASISRQTDLAVMQELTREGR